MTEKLRFFSYHNEETIFNQGNRVCGLHILCQGLVKMRFTTQDGRDLLIRFCRPGELLNRIAAKEHTFFRRVCRHFYSWFYHQGRGHGYH